MDRKHRAEIWLAFGVPTAGVLLYVALIVTRWGAHALAGIARSASARDVALTRAMPIERRAPRL